MAFPTLIDVRSSTQFTDNTSFSPLLPEGSNGLGTLVIAVVSVDGSEQPAWPAAEGWAVMDEGAVSGSGACWSARYKIVNGTEGYDGAGDTLTVTVSSAQEWIG